MSDVAKRKICENIDHEFKSEELLETALTHSSYIREKGLAAHECNERLEFLGDAILDVVISDILFSELETDSEGVLTKHRAKIVRGSSLAQIARSLGVGEAMRLSKGETHAGGKDRESILANAMEAIIAAVYLDAGYERSYELIERLFRRKIDEVTSGKGDKDYKSELQEWLQKDGPCDISYKLTGEEGPDHDKTFFVELEVNGLVIGRGSGKSKKSAEQEAAKEALEKGE